MTVELSSLVSNYKKMAGTSAVFLASDYQGASPVERDGMVWTAAELHLDQLPRDRQLKPPIHNALALEGLEEYDRPHDGDVRRVESVDSNFIYFDRIHAWVQLI